MAQPLRDAGDTVESAAKDRKEMIGRIGLAGRGVLYAVIALLALQLALGSPSEEASSEGALAWIGDQPLGRFLLVALTVSLACLALWRVLDALFGDPVEGDSGTDRLRFAAKAITYGALAAAAASITFSNWSGGSTGSNEGSDDGETQQQATAVVLDWPFGQWLVAAAGVAVMGYAVYMFKRHALDAHFTERLSGHSDTVTQLGRVGYGARSIVWAVVGLLVLRAAITYDPDEAGGLSAALQELAEAAWGSWLLGAVSIGLLAFAAFCLAEARYRTSA